jgi:hypothetical protein
MNGALKVVDNKSLQRIEEEGEIRIEHGIARLAKVFLHPLQRR